MKPLLITVAAAFLHACVPAAPAFAASEISRVQVDVPQWQRTQEAWKRLR